MTTVEGAGVPLHVVRQGDPGARAVLLVHDMATTHVALDAEADALSPFADVVRYDRRGYGGSGAPLVYTGTTPEEQGEDAAALLRALGLGPVVVAGVGFGALVALDLLHRRAELVRGAVLCDPALAGFVPAATEVLAKEHGRVQEAVFAGGPAAGVEAWLGRPPPDGVLPGFFADYAGRAALSVGRRELRAITARVVVLTGGATPRLTVMAADAVAPLLSRSRRRTDGDLVSAVRSLLR